MCVSVGWYIIFPFNKKAIGFHYWVCTFNSIFRKITHVFGFIEQQYVFEFIDGSDILNLK